MKYLILIIIVFLFVMYCEYFYPTRITNCIDYSGLFTEEGLPIPLRNDTLK